MMGLHSSSVKLARRCDLLKVTTPKLE